MYQVLIAGDELPEGVGIVSVIDWEKFGMEVVADVSNGQEALEAYSAYHPDVLITDIRMPVMSGMELIGKIRESDSGISIVIITCVEDFETVRGALPERVTGYILKMTTTIKEIETVLGKVQRELVNRKRFIGDRKLSLANDSAVLNKSMRVLGPEISKAIGFIEKNLSDVNLMNTARHVNLSQSYFSTVFKKEMGVSFSDYVIQARIDRAKELFIASDYKICYVASILGFNDPSYFSRVFKKITGIRPNEYRSKFLVN